MLLTPVHKLRSPVRDQALPDLGWLDIGDGELVGPAWPWRLTGGQCSGLIRVWLSWPEWPGWQVEEGE